MAEINSGKIAWNSNKHTGPRTEEQNQNNRISQLERWIKAKDVRDTEYFKNPTLCSFCMTPLSFRKRNKKYCNRTCTGKSKQK